MTRHTLSRTADRFGPPPVAPRASAWREWRLAFGPELFGRQAGPWGTLVTPVPLVGLALFALQLLPLPSGWSWLATRLSEVGWLLAVPFVLATVAQGVALAVSEVRIRKSSGKEHLDVSPRAWHYAAGTAIALLPLLALQFSGTALDLYLALSMKWHLMAGALQNAHVGYNPHPSNLLALAVLPAVAWQVRRLLVMIPCGRLTGMQRELARLRGAVAWDPEAWSLLVGDTFDRWLSDITPRNLEEPPATEAARLFRRRYLTLKKEVVASFVATPPDVPRANRALMQYREDMRTKKAVRF